MAFFSGTDVADEVAARYFGVIGKINDEIPELALKVAFNKQFVSLNYEDLFDNNVEKLHKNSNYYIDYESVKHLITERVVTYSYNKPAVPAATGTAKKYNPHLLEYYDDDDYYEGWEHYKTSNNKSKVIHTNSDLTNDTIFKDTPHELDTFIYDFKTLFKNRQYSPKLRQEVLNLYQSLNDLVFLNIEIDNALLNDIVDELLMNYDIMDQEQQEELLDE